ncbi:MAG: apolipoprotein N-acyltransferase [Opitutaceae bacterium]|nr:apolipoprotein N-acyltransferase [Opitutaceae bacterium]
MAPIMNNAEILSLDPYDEPPSFWRRNSHALAALGVFVSTVLLTLVSFPPFRFPEAAYAFAVPAVFWAYRRPRWKLFATVVLGASAVAWTLILSWLHQVSWIGMLLLGPVIGIWVGSWFLAVRWTMPQLLGRPHLTRILLVFGLAALWVLIEWSRTWLFSGFPWLPLAASQWQRVSILQIAAFTGSAGVSFVLIAVNLGFGAYAHRLLCEARRGLNRRSQEFFATMFLLVVCLSIQMQETINRGGYIVGLGKVAFVQPNIPSTLKWDPSEGPAIMETLQTLTRQAAAARPNLILWPEASTPWAIKGDEQIRRWTEELVAKGRAPLVLGSLAIEHPATPQEGWYNGAFLVDPVGGVQPGYYAKRKLVPFGEYVPYRPLLGWLQKVVPIGSDDILAGSEPGLLRTTLRNVPVSLGPLICYEDIFPNLARESVLAGADVLVVMTNDGWFGEGGAAYQHAAHSVLRAVETRRPVLRVGNSGWSGWIDEFGVTKAVATDPDHGVYFRGVRVTEVQRDFRWAGRNSFYVRHGDWFVVLCAFLVAGAITLLRVSPKPQEEETADPVEESPSGSPS